MPLDLAALRAQGEALQREVFPHAERPWYAIVGTARSGTTALCELLHSTGQLGVPGEWINSWHRPENPAEFPAFLEALREVYRPVKAFAYHLEVFGMEQAWLGQKVRPAYLYVTREDLVGAAVSAVMAHQTNQFHSFQDPQCEPQYNGSSIEDYMSRMERGRLYWESFFRDREIEPLRIRFEDLLSEPDRIAGEVLRFLGVWREPKPMRRFSSAKKAEWKRRFLGGT